MIDTLAPFCPNLQLLDTHATPDPQSSVFNSEQFFHMESHVEVKLAAVDDALSDEGDFESDEILSHDTRGRLVSYANAQMASQYRTHLFTVFICADKARLPRWDLAGVMVTHAF